MSQGTGRQVQQRQGLWARGGCSSPLARRKPQLGWQEPKGRTVTPLPISEPGIWVPPVPKIPPEQGGGRPQLHVPMSFLCPFLAPGLGGVVEPGWAPSRLSPLLEPVPSNPPDPSSAGLKTATKPSDNPKCHSQHQGRACSVLSTLQTQLHLGQPLYPATYSWTQGAKYPTNGVEPTRNNKNHSQQ